MATALTSFLDDLYSEFPATPDPEMERAVILAIRDFCTRSHVLQDDLDDVDVSSGTQEYTISNPTGFEIVALTSVKKDDEDDQYDQFDFVMPTFVLMDEPEVDFTLHLKAALRPALDATTVDDILYTDHMETIQYGAKARLFSKNGKQWFNPDLALFFGNLFASRAAEARVQSTTRLQRRPNGGGKPLNIGN